ncbi:MAG: VCBS repeat-containing protein [Myxococcales bacterium]|nr:VCBS repeat-containing protein [Myxococcales bacterium]
MGQVQVVRFAASRVVPLLVLAACTGTGRELLPSPAEVLDGGGPTGTEALSGVGVAPYRALVRATNRFGVSVETDDLSVMVDQTSVPTKFDGFGFGGVVLDQPGSYAITPVGGTGATVHVLQTDWPGYPFAPAWVAPIDDADQLLAVTGGYVGRKGGELWYAGGDTGPHRVLGTDDEILGVSAVQIDVDGVTDLVAWTAQDVFLLRGRAGGGFSWGTAFHAAGLTVAGADVADLSGDNLPDLAIAWTAGDGYGVLDIWEGDGLMAFTAAEPRSLSSRPTSLRIADATGDEIPQITVLLEDGSWERFVRGAELQYIPIGPFFPVSILMPRDAGMIPFGDLNRDGGDEIAIVTARTPGVGRTAWMIDLAIDIYACNNGDPQAVCTTAFTEIGMPTAAWLTNGDADGDLLDDLWVLNEDGALELYKHDSALGESLLGHSVIGDIPSPGPIASNDVDHDGVDDLTVAGSTVWRQWIAGPPADPDAVWAPALPDRVFVREGVHPWYARGELDGDAGTMELATTATEDGVTVLKVLQYTPGMGRAPSIAQRDLGVGGAIPTDLALCGNQAFVAAGGQVLRVDLSDPTHPVIEATAGGGATRLACGAGPSGSVVAVLGNGQVVLRNRDLVEVGSTPAAGATDVELLDLGGATREVRTCATEGCGIAALPLESGQIAVVVGDDDGLRLEAAAGQSPELDGGGRPLVADVDNDGHADLVAISSTGLLTLHRTTKNGIAHGELSNVPMAIRGTVLEVDGDQDGWRDLWAVNADGELVFVPVTAGEATLRTDTGDTGLP